VANAEGVSRPADRRRTYRAALQIGTTTVEQLRKRFLKGGWRRHDWPPTAECPADGRGEAVLVVWACNILPDERSYWTTQALADMLVELRIVETISGDTVRRVLNQTTSSPG
jgi:hypothetical protein